MSKERTEAAPGFSPTEIKKSRLEEGGLGLEVEQGTCGPWRGHSSRQLCLWVKNETDAVSSVELTSACVEVRRQLARVVLSFPCVGSQG